MEELTFLHIFFELAWSQTVISSLGFLNYPFKTFLNITPSKIKFIFDLGNERWD
jgi:hypothetical protein